MPSPPVYRMLKDYLPNLHATRGTGLLDWAKLKPLFNDAQKLGEYRNKLTHAGKMPEEALAVLPDLMNTGSDLLYVLDVLEGHQWAKECVGRKTRTLLGWPNPRRKRYLVTLVALAR